MAKKEFPIILYRIIYLTVLTSPFWNIYGSIKFISLSQEKEAPYWAITGMR
jgi:hypothetical protein